MFVLSNIYQAGASSVELSSPDTTQTQHVNKVLANQCSGLVLVQDDREKVVRIPKIRQKRVYFHDKKSQIHFLKGQKWPKTEKIGIKKLFTQSGTLRTLGKHPKIIYQF